MVTIRERYGTGIIANGTGIIPTTLTSISHSIDRNYYDALRENIRGQLAEHIWLEDQIPHNIYGYEHNTHSSSFHYEFENNGFYRNPFEEEVSPSSMEFRNAMGEAAMSMMAEYPLQREDLMFILSIEGYEMLTDNRLYCREFMGIQIHVSHDQIDLYKLVVKGEKGYRIARNKAMKLMK